MQPGWVSRAVVAARWPIAILWVAAAVAAATLLPGLGSGAAPIADLVPENSSAVSTDARAAQLFGTPAMTDVAVVQRRPAGLTRADVRTQARLAADGAGMPLVNADVPGTHWNERRTTIFTPLAVDPVESLEEHLATGQAYARELGGGAHVGVTGAGPARLSQFAHIEDRLPLITVASVVLIVVLVALTFRSLWAPLMTLGTAGIAYVIATHGAAWLSERAGISAPREIEPLLVVLLLGLATDYCVFFLAEARRRAQAGASRLDAARGAVARVGPTVLTAGLIVAACSAALLVGRLDFFRVFGPGLALCALVVTAVSATLAPALLAIAGPRLHGGACPVDAQDVGPAEPATEQPARLPRLLTARPVSVVLLVLAVGGLAWSASHARDVELGVSLVSGLPGDDAVRRAADDAGRGFAGGIIAPTEVVLERSGIGAGRAGAVERARAVLSRDGDIAAVAGPATGRPLQAAGVRSPFVSQDGSAARLLVVFRGDPTSAAAIDRLHALQARLPGLLPDGTRISYAGETALAAETTEAISDDLVRIAAAIGAVSLVLLALYLRALVAPVVLLLCSALGYLAALGLTSLIMHAWHGDEQLTYYVPLVGAVLLLALGSDYNVLVAGRVRAEAGRREAREAIAVAVPQASRAITAAGVTLAASFALLALVPLRPFAELGLLLGLGVLVDVLVVRPLLVASALSLLRDAAWWPSAPTTSSTAGSRRSSPRPAASPAGSSWSSPQPPPAASTSSSWPPARTSGSDGPR